MICLMGKSYRAFVSCKRLSIIFVPGGAGAFGTDHAGADGGDRGALVGKEGTIGRFGLALDDFAAKAAGWFGILAERYREVLQGVEPLVAGAEGQSAGGDGSDGAPDSVGRLENTVY